MNEFIAALPREHRLRIAEAYNNVQVLDPEVSGAVMVAFVMDEFANLVKGTKERRVSLDTLVEESLTKRVAQLAANRTTLDLLENELRDQMAILAEPKGYFGFLGSLKFRLWSTFVVLLLLLVGGGAWAVQSRINAHYEACSTVESYQVALLEDARHKGLKQAVNYLAVRRRIHGCY